MKILVGTDEEALVVDSIAEHLRVLGHDVRTTGALPWVEAGRAVGNAVAAGEVDMGVVFCWTGTGVTMAANKIPGARAALCADAPTAEGARRWNDANVLALSLRTTTFATGKEIVDAFLSSQPDEDECRVLVGLEGPVS